MDGKAELTQTGQEQSKRVEKIKSSVSNEGDKPAASEHKEIFRRTFDRLRRSVGMEKRSDDDQKRIAEEETALVGRLKRMHPNRLSLGTRIAAGILAASLTIGIAREAISAEQPVQPAPYEDVDASIQDPSKIIISNMNHEAKAMLDKLGILGMVTKNNIVNDIKSIDTDIFEKYVETGDKTGLENAGEYTMKLVDTYGRGLQEIKRQYPDKYVETKNYIKGIVEMIKKTSKSELSEKFDQLAAGKLKIPQGLPS